MKLPLSKTDAAAVLQKHFPCQSEDVAGLLGWLAWTGLEFLEPGETPPPIALSTGASLCYVRVGRKDGWAFRWWIEGSIAEVQASLVFLVAQEEPVQKAA